MRKYCGDVNKAYGEPKERLVGYFCTAWCSLMTSLKRRKKAKSPALLFVPAFFTSKINVTASCFSLRFLKLLFLSAVV